MIVQLAQAMSRENMRPADAANREKPADAHEFRALVTRNGRDLHGGKNPEGSRAAVAANFMARTGAKTDDALLAKEVQASETAEDETPGKTEGEGEPSGQAGSVAFFPDVKLVHSLVQHAARQKGEAGEKSLAKCSDGVEVAAVDDDVPAIIAATGDKPLRARGGLPESDRIDSGVRQAPGKSGNLLSEKTQTPDKTDDGIAMIAKTAGPVADKTISWAQPGINFQTQMAMAIKDAAVDKAMAASAPPEAKMTQTGEIKTLRIALHPADFGHLDVQLKAAGDDMHIVVRTQSSAAHARLSAEKDDLRRSLELQGITVASITVQAPMEPSQSGAAGFGQTGANPMADPGGRGEFGKPSGQTRHDAGNSVEIAESTRQESPDTGLYI